MATDSPLRTLERSRLLDLTTFRTSGVGVTTPVRFAIDGDRIVVSVRTDSGKVKRLRADPNVRVAGHGDPHWLHGTIRELRAEEGRAGYGLLKRRYKFLTFQRFIFGRHPRRHISAEIRLSPEG